MKRVLSVAIRIALIAAGSLSPLVVYSAPKKTLTDERGAKPAFGGIYRRGLGNDPASLDPAKITDIYEEVVTQQIFEGLVQYSDNLMVVPCIAESWESSRDNLQWTFHLKRGVAFHNGKEVTAEDFVYTFTRILSPETGSIAASLLSRIEGAGEFREGKADHVEGLKSLDRYTLRIQLGEQFPPFIAVMAMVNFGVVPREEVEAKGETAQFGTRPVGTGPFRFERWDRGKEILLKANENYHEGKPYLDRVTFIIFPGASTDRMLAEFEAGNLEDSDLSAAKRETILAEKRYPVLRRPSLVIRMLVMNNAIPPFDDKRVRRALNYAIDKERISQDVGKGRFIPASGLIPQGMAGYQPDTDNYPYSPEKAAQLLQQAGYPGGKGFPVIQFWSSVKSKGTLEEDREIERYFSAIGLRTEFNYQTDWPAFKKMLQEGKAPMFKYSWEADIPDPDNILNSLFHSKSPTNRAFYKSPDVDSLIGRAQNETDYRKRISLYTAVQNRILEDAPVIPLNTQAYERVFQPYVIGFEGKALGDHYFSLKRVWFER
jgi:peptide/nickel transport system substrate-binding protein/oligopeptide transport system substrate-binding protein